MRSPVLDDLRGRLNATAVLVVRTTDASEALVASPDSLCGMVWPAVRYSEGLLTDPGELAAVLPTSVRLRLDRPSAVAVREIGADGLVLLVAWPDAAPSGALSALDETSRSGLNVALAGAAWQELAHRERLALRSVLSALDTAVIRTHSGRGEVTFNEAAAKLLGLDTAAGVADVSQAMLALQYRASNPEEIAALAGALRGGSAAAGIWRFPQAPTHVKVSSHDDTDGGRVWLLTDVSAEYALLEIEQQARRRLRITSDSLLDPQVLLEPVRDDQGEIEAFVYAEVNEACCTYLDMPRSDLIGASVEASLPQLRESGLFAAYVDVLMTGEPLVLDDFGFYNDILADQRRYDIRVAKAGDGLTLTWRDVTKRSEDARLRQQSEERLAATIDSMLTPHLMLARVIEDGELVDMRISSANVAAGEYLGVAAGDLLRVSIQGGLRPDQFALLMAWCREVLEGSGRIELDDVRFPADDGGHRFMDVRLVRVGDEVSFAFQDVTDRHRMVERIAESETHYRLLAQSSSDVVVLVRDGTVAWASPALRDALGWPPSAWDGRSFLERVDPHDRPTAQDHVERVERGATEVVTVRMPGSDGIGHWVELHSSPYVDEAGQRSGIVTSFRVVDVEVAEDAELERQARVDGLTGLLNRREAVEFLRAATVDALATTSRVGVLFCDLDLFKSINDNFGHAAGDHVLKVVADRLVGSVRAMDVVARIGGDELVVILPGLGDADRLLRLAEEIHGKVSRAVSYQGVPIPVSLSIGAALAREGEGPQELIARADRAMYEAKRAGRDQVVTIR